MKKTISFILAAVMVLSMVLSLTGCGASLSDYTIITPDDGMERTYNAARELQKYIKSTTEETVRISTNVGDTETAIFVGQVDNDVVAAATKDEFVTPMDYVIKVVGKNIVVAGGSTFANAAAVDKMLSLLQSEEMQIKDGYEYEFHFLDTYELNPLVSNPDAFTAKWANEYTAPEWLYDQKEKIYAITHKDSGRLAVVSHRCDFVYYPEGTLEAVLSCILAGVDAIELDVHLTKDNIPVVRHDENLSRNTNFGSKAGKDGLPTSNMIGDWTYEQLQQEWNVQWDVTAPATLLVKKEGGLSQGYHDITYGFYFTSSYMPPLMQNGLDPDREHFVILPEFGHHVNSRKLIIV